MSHIQHESTSYTQATKFTRIQGKIASNGRIRTVLSHSIIKQTMRPMGRSRSVYHTHVSPKMLFLGLSGSFEGYGGRSILESEISTSNVKENTLEAQEMSWSTLRALFHKMQFFSAVTHC